jgi:hypothetical protein
MPMVHERFLSLPLLWILNEAGEFDKWESTVVSKFQRHVPHFKQGPYLLIFQYVQYSLGVPI